MSVWGRIAGFLGAGPRRVLHVFSRGAIHGSYDLARTSDANRRHWAVADAYDADSANSIAVRQLAVRRSRYETNNNGYLKGITRTQANYVVGRGPKLRMQTANPGMNAMVEAAWKRWAAAVKLTRKLRTAIKAKITDGEAFLLATQNENLPDTVKMGLVGIETEQVASTDLLFGQKGRVDGIWFDEFGNPTAYDILPQHPGGQWWPTTWQAKKVPAKFVFHLFQEERAGQHRAIPELSATLSTCGQSRRWREAVLTAAENLADFSLFLPGPTSPNTEADYDVAALSTLEIQKGAMVQLPGGAPFQPKAEQPPATYEGFLKSQVGEQARPLSMPYTLAACDSSNSNFASAKLDQHPFFMAIDVEQAEIEEIVLDPLFSLWFAQATLDYDWGFDGEPAPPHTWDWPARPQIDEEKTSTSRKIDLSTGVKSPRRIAAEDGYDWEEELQAMAEDYGVTTEDMRAILRRVNLPYDAQADSHYMVSEMRTRDGLPEVPGAAAIYMPSTQIPAIEEAEEGAAVGNGKAPTAKNGKAKPPAKNGKPAATKNGNGMETRKMGTMR